VKNTDLEDKKNTDFEEKKKLKLSQILNQFQKK
jgi:hypothetical protein